MFEPPESMSLLSCKEDLSIIHQEIRTIAAETVKDAVLNVLCCLNLLSHKFESISSSQFILMISIQIIQTSVTFITTFILHICMEVIKFKDIDYFDSKLYTELMISDSKNSSIIHDVFLFINCLCEIIIHTMSNQQSIPIKLCLQDIAMKWFHLKLSLSKCSKLLMINAWIEVLTQQFGLSKSEAMITILNEHYICNDVTNHCEPTAYIQTIVRHRKATVLFMPSVLVIAYQNINSELQHNLNNFIKTLVFLFVKNIETKKSIWFDLYKWCSYTNSSYFMNSSYHTNSPYLSNQQSQYWSSNSSYNSSTTSNQSSYQYEWNVWPNQSYNQSSHWSHKL